MFSNKTMTILFLMGSILFGSVSSSALANDDPLSNLHQEQGEEQHKPIPVAPVNINTATIDELRSLKGIGPKRAEAIAAERINGQFKSVEELSRVKGLTPKIITKLISENPGKIKVS